MKTMASALALLATALAGCAGGDDPSGGPEVTQVEFVTSKGRFVADLYDSKTPVTVANFKRYVEEGHYDGLLFHRIGKDFMLQTGSMAQDGSQRPAAHPPIKNEAAASGLLNLEYTLAMARTDAPDSATASFFINTANNAFLDPGGSSAAGYAVFGIVTEGREVVDAIEATPTTMYTPGSKCQPDRSPTCPQEEVVIESVRILG